METHHYDQGGDYGYDDYGQGDYSGDGNYGAEHYFDNSQPFNDGFAGDDIWD